MSAHRDPSWGIKSMPTAEREMAAAAAKRHDRSQGEWLAEAIRTQLALDAGELVPAGRRVLPPGEAVETRVEPATVEAMARGLRGNGGCQPACAPGDATAGMAADVGGYGRRRRLDTTATQAGETKGFAGQPGVAPLTRTMPPRIGVGSHAATMVRPQNSAHLAASRMAPEPGNRSSI